MPWDSSRRRKDPPGWGKIRAQVIARAQGQCEDTLPASLPGATPQRCGYPGTDVDHILNVARGGTNDLSNLQLLCEWHHKKKTQAEARANRKIRTERIPKEPHPGILRDQEPSGPTDR